MRQTPTLTILGTVLVVCVMSAARDARAGKLDLTLSNFANCNTAGQCNHLFADYETFLAEYVFGIAPKKMAPAETLGFSGFYMGFEGNLSIRPTGDAAETRWDRGTPGEEVQAVMFNPGIHIRKGLPFSFEVGSTVSWLVLSQLVSLGGEIKWSLFEGYRTGWRAFLPDVAVRGSIVRIMGQGDVDMSLVGVDGSISYAFGIGGMLTLTPYAGYQFNWSIINLEPMLYQSNGYHQEITTPGGDKLWNTSDLGNPILKRSSTFYGVRLGYEMLAFTLEVDWALPNSWTTEGDSSVTAKVGHQIQVNFGVGADF